MYQYTVFDCEIDSDITNTEIGKKIIELFKDKGGH